MNGVPGFAVWITGLPASGKSSVTHALVTELQATGVRPVVLESDVLRTILTPEPTYRVDERDRFYVQMADLGILITAQGIPVIFDATANRRRYRDRARSSIVRYLEVLIDTPLEICQLRDPKGIYRTTGSTPVATVPGVHVPYERPLSPDLIIQGQEVPRQSAARILKHLRQVGYI